MQLHLYAPPLLVSQLVSPGTHYLQLGYRGTFASPQSRIGLFTIKFYGVCLRPPIPRPCANTNIQLKYVIPQYCDSTKFASENMKQSLQDDPMERQLPFNYHERTQKSLKPEDNVLQKELYRFYDETTRNNLGRNQSKSFVMVFNQSRKL